MAGDWIQIDTGIEDKPEFIRLLDLTDEPEDVIIGRLVRLWCWVDKSTEDGFLQGITAKSLARKLGGTPEFWECLTDSAVGWLELSDDGVRIPGYENRFSNSAKRRAKEAKRKASARKTDDGAEAAHACGQNADSKQTESGHDAELKKNREEKNKEEQKKPQKRAPSGAGGGSSEKKPKFDPASVGLPYPSERFRRCWLDWCAHRREKRIPLTPTSVSRQLARLAEMGELAAVAAVDKAIANGWQGVVFDEKGRAGPGEKPRETVDSLYPPLQRPQ